MDLITINIFIAVIGTGIAAYWDYKTGIVPDKLSHAMIISGAALAPLVFTDLLYVYGVAALIFALGYVMYIFGQIGGGDVKLFTALSLLIPIYPEKLAGLIKSIGINPVSPNYPFAASVFIFAGVVGYMLIISLIYHKKIWNRRSEVEEFRKKLKKGILFSLITLPLAAFWVTISPGFLFLVIPLAISISLLPFKEDMIKLFHGRKKEIQELDEDDVIALEEVGDEKKESLGIWRRTLTNPELLKIKKKAEEQGFKEIVVCEDLPRFVPYIFLSLVLNLVFGDAFLYMIKLTMI